LSLSGYSDEFNFKLKKVIKILLISCIKVIKVLLLR
jgi:hypothetical protein